MHEQLGGIKPWEETGASDAPGLWVRVDELETLELEGKHNVERAHAGNAVNIAVTAQLDALEPKEARKRKEVAAKRVEPSATGRNNRGPLKVFVSYAHADEKTRKKDVTAVLKVLENEQLVTVWDDRMLVAGDDWDTEIREKVRSADLVIFLVSREFLISKYIKSVEAKTALQRAEEGKARIVPIILKRCTWQNEPWKKHQALPTDGRGLKPVQDWKPQSHAWQEVEEQLRKAACKTLAESGRRDV